jgi:hypothetical protein
MSNLQLLTAGVLALVAGASISSATKHHVISGTIDHLSKARHVLLLRNHSYHFVDRALADGFRRGDRVTIRYRDWHGHRTAVEIATAKP